MSGNENFASEMYKTYPIAAVIQVISAEVMYKSRPMVAVLMMTEPWRNVVEPTAIVTVNTKTHS